MSNYYSREQSGPPSSPLDNHHRWQRRIKTVCAVHEFPGLRAPYRCGFPWPWLIAVSLQNGWHDRVDIEPQTRLHFPIPVSNP